MSYENQLHYCYGRRVDLTSSVLERNRFTVDQTHLRLVPQQTVDTTS